MIARQCCVRTEYICMYLYDVSLCFIRMYTHGHPEMYCMCIILIPKQYSDCITYLASACTCPPPPSKKKRKNVRIHFILQTSAGVYTTN